MSSTVEYIKITPTGILLISDTLDSQSRNFQKIEEQHDLTLEQTFTKGMLSDNSKRKLKGAFNLINAISPMRKFQHPEKDIMCKFKLTFITLTLSAKQGIHTDIEIKRELLNHFLITIKRSFGVKHYVWRA